jgi:surfactin synthase thioesterase subunit
VRFERSHLALDRSPAEARALFFHHACGSATSYLPIAQALPQTCEPALFELAGRGMRDTEPYAADFKSAVLGLMPDVVALADRPIVLFGHSLGGLLAHNLLNLLPERARSQVKAVVVSASYAPDEAAANASHPPSPFQVRTREQLISQLRSRGGCPPDMLEDQDFVEHALTVFGQDLHLADTYSLPHGAVADVPYHVWYGAEDPYLTTAHAERWARCVPKVIEIRGFRGGHFYLLNHDRATAALSRLVAEATA